MFTTVVHRTDGSSVNSSGDGICATRLHAIWFGKVNFWDICDRVNWFRLNHNNLWLKKGFLFSLSDCAFVSIEFFKPLIFSSPILFFTYVISVIVFISLQFMRPKLRDIQVTQETKSLVICQMGHVCVGMNGTRKTKIESALRFYGL